MRNNCRWKPKAIVTFLILFSCLVSKAQISLETPLKEILPGLEERFDVRFSYLDRDLEDIRVKLPGDLEELDQILNFLQEQTPLSFIFLNDRYIAIKRIGQRETICLLLKDGKTGTPLSGAGLYDSKGNLLTYSNEGGEILIEHYRANERLIVRHLGFNPVELKSELLSRGKCPEVFMIPFMEVLGESVVVNYLTAGVSKRRDGSTVIRTEDFGSLPGMVEPDILHMIEALPGVESVNETVSSINIRGGTSDQNLVLYDGVKMYLTGHFFGLISAFNPGLTNKASLTKNGTSSEFSDGVSGTIDISSKNEITGNFSGGAGVSLVSADAHLQIPVIENLEVHISGRRSIHDFYRSPTFSSYFTRTFQETEVFEGGDLDPGKEAGFNFHDYSGKILYDISNDHKLRLTGLVIENRLDYSGSSNSEAEEGKVNSLAQKNLLVGGSWTSSWTEELQTSIHTYFTRYRLWALDRDNQTQQSLIQSNEVLETGAKVNLKYALNEGFDFHGGYQFSETGVSNIELVNNPFFSSRIKTVLKSHAVFTDISYEEDKLFIRGGLRLNYFARFDKFIVEPRINANYKVTPAVSVKLQGEQKSQALSQIIDLQEDFLGVENRRWILANDRDFPVLESDQISGGIDFKSGGWFLDLTAFYKQVNGINTSTQGFRDQHEFLRTVGSYDSHGLEFLINKKFENLQLYMNYTWAESSYEFPVLEPSDFPNNLDVRHSFSLALNYNFKSLKISLGGKTASGRPYTAPVRGNETWREGNLWFVNYASPNAENLPYYLRLDASASYSFKINDRLKAKLNAGILNLTDRKNLINRYFRVNEEDKTSAVKIDERSLGFTPNLMLRIDF